MLENFPTPWQMKLNIIAGNDNGGGDVPVPDSPVILVHDVNGTLDITAQDVKDAFDAGKIMVLVIVDSTDTYMCPLAGLYDAGDGSAYTATFSNLVDFSPLLYGSTDKDDYLVAE